MKCEKCGAELAEGQKFCSNCGTPVPETVSEPEPEVAPDAAPEAVPPVVEAEVIDAQSSQVPPVPGSAQASAAAGAAAAGAASTQIPPQQGYIPPQPQPQAAPIPAAAKSRVTAGVLGILLGGLGIHKFYLGYNTPGLIMLLITLIASWFTAGIAGGVVWVIGLIEGIIYLTKSDREFFDQYVARKKEWF